MGKKKKEREKRLGKKKSFGGMCVPLASIILPGMRHLYCTSTTTSLYNYDIFVQGG